MSYTTMQPEDHYVLSVNSLSLRSVSMPWGRSFTQNTLPVLFAWSDSSKAISKSIGAMLIVLAVIVNCLKAINNLSEVFNMFIVCTNCTKFSQTLK